MHARCRCTIVAYLEGIGKGKDERAARDDGGKYTRVPDDMNYRDWKAVYIDKSKTLDMWRAEFDARRKADEQSPLRQRGRQVIDDLAAGRDPRAAKGDGAEMQRRWQAQDGHEIIDKPTYNKLTKSFLKAGGIIIRGEDAARHLASSGAYASYISGANTAFITDDATISDVLEEMYHAYQDRVKMFGDITDMVVVYKREIDAQKYLLRVADKYKIPETELAVTRRNLENYEKQLAELLKGGDKNGQE